MKIITKDINDLIPYENNAKLHPKEQIEQIKNSIKEFGNNDPIAVDENNIIIEGHGRYEALKELGYENIEVIVLDGLTEEQKNAYRIVHNQLTMNTDWDIDKLKEELNAINFDMSTLGFDEELLDEAERELKEKINNEEQEEAETNKLIDTFIVPPFSVFDTKQGYWQDRKRKWLEITGDLVATKEDVLGGSGLRILAEKHGSKTLKGTSQFDPVLCEVIYKWFSRDNVKILDPFGGEQTKGVVAGELGFAYEAVEFRQEQVDYNKEKTSKYEGVKYHCGDSNNIDEIIKDRGFNLCFTSPPYYDLEVYSKEDMSSLGTYEEFMQQYENIFSKCYSMLEENSFLVLKVGEIRNKKTGQYRGFVADNIKIMERIGFKYYNEIILLNQIATAALRTKAQMNNRKVVKIHQNVLVFYKGELNEISEHFKKLTAGGDYIETE